MIRYAVELHLASGDWVRMLYAFSTWEGANDHALDAANLMYPAVKAWRVVGCIAS